MNTRLNKLQAYPFERLARLLQSEAPANVTPVNLSIGEPRHSAPAIVTEALAANLDKISKYPPTKGSAELREAITEWLRKRYQLAIDMLSADRSVLPVNGTREALFAIAQCLFDSSDNKKNLVLMPNPFYQIYEGAALLAGAEPWYYTTGAENRYKPDFNQIPVDVWQRCQLIYICNPGNPAGATLDSADLQTLIQLAHTHDFYIVADECYSEIYSEDQPPVGLLQAASDYGNTTLEHCLVFNSLSKRSNLPGLRSGFVAGNSELIKQFLLYRTYHGCAMSGMVSAASVVAWQDETHVVQNRTLYQQKFQLVEQQLSPSLNASIPDAGFFLWLALQEDDEQFCRELYRTQNITVLPGSYLSRASNHNNPGARHIRMALVADLENCRQAIQRINQFVESRSTH